MNPTVFLGNAQPVHLAHDAREAGTISGAIDAADRQRRDGGVIDDELGLAVAIHLGDGIGKCSLVENDFAPAPRSDGFYFGCVDFLCTHRSHSPALTRLEHSYGSARCRYAHTPFDQRDSCEVTLISYGERSAQSSDTIVTRAHDKWAQSVVSDLEKSLALFQYNSTLCVVIQNRDARARVQRHPRTVIEIDDALSAGSSRV